MLLEGLHISLTTPFHPDGRLALHKLASNVARYSKTPAAGLVVLGPSGEPTLLNDEETREVVRTAAESAAPEKVLIAGISRDSVHSTLGLANFAAEQHYDAVLAGVPTVLPHPTFVEHDIELLNYFQSLADRSPLPLILLNVPIGASARLAGHPNILGLLTDADPSAVTEIVARTAEIRRQATVTPTFTAVTNRMNNIRASAGNTLVSVGSLAGGTATSVADAPALRTRTKTVRFQIIAGRSQGLLDSLRAGAIGIAPPFAASAPQACYEVFAAWKDEDQSLAEEKQSRLDPPGYLVERRLGVAALKHACDLNGYFGGQPRLPHLPLTGEHRSALEELMKDIRN